VNETAHGSEELGHGADIVGRMRRYAGPDDPPIHLDDVPEQSWEVDEIKARRWRLGAAAGAHKIGIAIIEAPPGGRLTPPHSHADEEEIFFVLDGSGLSYQFESRSKTHTYEIRKGDCLVHPCDGPAHTMIAGDGGLRVLVAAEGSRTSITYLPRAKMFWLGSRWTPADALHPFQADAEIGPLDLPEPTAERPSSIVAFDDCPFDEGGRGRFRWATRDLGKAAGAQTMVLAHDAFPPRSLNCPRHWHTAAEECFFVLSGTGIARIGDAEHPLRAGSFFLRPPRTGVGHRIEAGPDGIEVITMGDLVPDDICVYPDSRKIAVRPGVFLPISDLTYFDGETDAEAVWPIAD
jgi:uncharacterized cupin superfamily protein